MTPRSHADNSLVTAHTSGGPVFVLFDNIRLNLLLLSFDDPTALLAVQNCQCQDSGISLGMACVTFVD